MQKQKLSHPNASSSKSPLAMNVKNSAELLDILRQNKNFKDALKYASDHYNVNPYKVSKIKIQEISELLNLIEVTYINLERAESKDKKFKYSWQPNQLKLFICLLVTHSYIVGKPIEKYGDEEWEFFTEIFTRKNREELQFQSKAIFKNFHGNKEKWSEEEQNLLKELVESGQLDGKWNEISRMIFFRSGKRFYRSSQRCREYWFNHMDPTLNKDPWSLEQDIDLVKFIAEHGFKWSRLTKEVIKGKKYRRTEHMVKNRTKYLFKKYGFQEEAGENSGKKEIRQVLKRLRQQQKNIHSSGHANGEEKSKSDKAVESNEVKVEGFHDLLEWSIRQEFQPSFGKGKAVGRGFPLKVTDQHRSGHQSIQHSDEGSGESFEQKGAVCVNNPNSIQTKRNIIVLKHQQFENSHSEEEQASLETARLVYHKNDRGGKKFPTFQIQTIPMSSAVDSAWGKGRADTANNNPSQRQQGANEDGLSNQSYDQNIQPRATALSSQIAADNGESLSEEQSCFDEYQIIEDVEDSNGGQIRLDFNKEPEFQHETHGGKMRQKVTHELAKFFDGNPNGAGRDSSNAAVDDGYGGNNPDFVGNGAGKGGMY